MSLSIKSKSHSSTNLELKFQWLQTQVSINNETAPTFKVQRIIIKYYDDRPILSNRKFDYWKSFSLFSSFYQKTTVLIWFGSLVQCTPKRNGDDDDNGDMNLPRRFMVYDGECWTMFPYFVHKIIHHLFHFSYVIQCAGVLRSYTSSIAFVYSM